MKKLVIFLFLAFVSTAIFCQNVAITVTNLKTSNGQVSLGIYKDQATFDKETPYLLKGFSKSGQVSGGTMKISLSLPPGDYGVTMLDDENNDSKMEYNWLSLPREGFGFSNYYTGGFSKPKFSDFRITVVAGKTTTATIKVRYL